jgi:transcriptional regulator with XRE-family HTH domain
MALNEIIRAMSGEKVTFGGLLKEARLKKRLTQKQVAKLLDLPFRTYQNYEYDQRQPNGAALLKIIKLFDFELKDIEKVLHND